MKTAIALRHVAFEGLDGFAPALKDAGYTIRYVDMCDGAPAAEELAAADLLVVLGGPIGADQTDAYPFLKHEIAAIEARLAAGTPLMGICLGAQLIAAAAGARTYPAPAREIGFGPVALTDAGRESCLAPFTAAPQTLHWHGDTFDLPVGARLLASTGVCENQAYDLGPDVIAFQFHPEATGRTLEHWLVGHAHELAANGIDPAALRAEAATLAGALQDKADAVMRGWLAGVAAAG